uniref:NADH-ubiquinone oxidoreductase chain 3 n=1 Tax=Plectrocnemia tortosa TaxID=623669 RepID=A0A9E8RSN1_9NEOP|nr:NADH dehydrogenase subunit 3 [Plectrocnemia tortosa]UZZ44266.1 NADH dehydrogenase subunit 3 [Plectrocnemia tortosa]
MIMSIMMLMLLISFILIIMISMNLIISKNSLNNLNKLSPFECGFNSISKSQPPFSMNFYLMTILFLMFDIEISIMLPFFIINKMCNMKFFMVTFLIFMYMLTLGLFHEWNQNILNWKI